jgi:hypothetical protein
MNKRGPKTKETYQCNCCDPPNEFKSSKNKGDHESRKRIKLKIAQSAATPSMAGEKLDERMQDFQVTEK